VIGTAYLDASGAMRRLLAWRTGHAVARQVWDEADDVVTVTLTYPEVCSALAAARRNRALTEPGWRLALEAWDVLWAQLAPVVLDEPLAKAAGDLAQVHALRGADAVHLAVAQAAGCDLLLSSDVALCSAAERCGMSTLDLNAAT
jgi:predicted nucleic acid-binding protein